MTKRQRMLHKNGLSIKPRPAKRGERAEALQEWYEDEYRVLGTEQCGGGRRIIRKKIGGA